MRSGARRVKTHFELRAGVDFSPFIFFSRVPASVALSLFLSLSRSLSLSLALSLPVYVSFSILLGLRQTVVFGDKRPQFALQMPIQSNLQMLHAFITL